MPMGSAEMGEEEPPVPLAPCCSQPRPSRPSPRGPLTQMRHAAEAGVEADLAHLVGARQEEVDHAVGDHAAREADELVVEAAPLPEAVPAARRSWLQAQQLPVGRGEARDLSYRAPHLPGVGGRLQAGRNGTGGGLYSLCPPLVPLPGPSGSASSSSLVPGQAAVSWVSPAVV